MYIYIYIYTHIHMYNVHIHREVEETTGALGTVPMPPGDFRMSQRWPPGASGPTSTCTRGPGSGGRSQEAGRDRDNSP